MTLLSLKTKKLFNFNQGSFQVFHILKYSKIKNLTLELKILSHFYRGIFVFSYWFFFFGNYWVCQGDNIICHLIIFLVEKVVGVCCVRANK
jgi:hypothetical protein